MNFEFSRQKLITSYVVDGGSNQGPLGNWNAANPTAGQTHPNLNFRAKLHISKVFKYLNFARKCRKYETF